MIKIRLNSTKYNRLIELHKQILSNPYKIKENLNKTLIASNHNTHTHKFYSFLQNHLALLLFGTPNEIRDLQRNLNPLYLDALKENNCLKKELKVIFNYNKFRNTRKAYGAYTFTEFLQVNVCPYCNRVSTITHIGKHGSTRPQLDHWLSQEAFPYFAISLFNLIPSCSICNTNFKKRTNFDFDNYIHPFIEGYEREFKFSHKPKLISSSITSVDDFSISLREQENISNGIRIKGKNMIELLNIEELYNKHKDEALNIIGLTNMYPEAAILAQLNLKDNKTGKSLYNNRKEFIEIAFSLKVDIEDYGTKVLSKFRKDIAEDFGLTF